MGEISEIPESSESLESSKISETPKYTFKQTLKEVTVEVPLSQPTRAKLLEISIQRLHIQAKSKLGQETLIDGELFAPVKSDESTWTVVDQKELEITLVKTKEEWWPHVVTTDPKIDVSKIVPENSQLSDLDPETRATVEKMMFDQQQKQLGKPTSDEMKKQQMLENFKKQHPEMDFSKVKTS